MDRNATNPVAARILVGVFGMVFLGTGLAVIIFLWSASGIEAPPPIFRVVGSFISIAFIAFGGTMAVGAVRGGMLLPRPGLPPGVVSKGGEGPIAPVAGYACPSCGAVLDKQADVSPLGDVKCASCGSWFNIHGRST